jgi:uncharacterized protein YjbJ (UPF0337 family)
MKPSTRNQAKGAVREIKGKAKEAVGRLTGNTRLKVKGRVQAAAGRVQRKLGKAESNLDKDLKRDIETAE